ncbi:NAD-dependent epimerase/dehydratase family protein [Catelliglobosispora koreensis]|uniref:NAD-dependent epimerase/dehydratase family protein n=1 Tax=Catelliglobosispora koreensis TaxID=129052 RepID=UPI0003616456|nr:NAD-dependent epimerase/dehydratase family protein [Catelliglobosispora koreensis]
MKILILGGTVFLGRAAARAAVEAGHEVTCAARGVSGSVPDGVTFVEIDRSSPDGLSALEGTFDAAIDVARWPSHVRNSLAALEGRVGHWTFVSSCSAYSDDSVPLALAHQLPLHDPLPEDGEEVMENYGPAKVACEQLFAATGVPTFVCRAGLIVGPEDIGNRFSYWVSRLDRGGEILAPGTPEDYVQWIDVRDLGAWLVKAAETGLTGAFDGIGAPVTRSEFFDGIASGLSVAPSLTWVPQEFLAEQNVSPWAGERSLPMWLPLPEYAGFMSHDVSPSLAAGLIQRPLAETARDTLAATGEGTAIRAGLTAEEEAEVLAAWHKSS